MLGTVVIVYGLVLSADSAPLSTAMTELADDEHVGTALAGQSFLGFVPGVILPGRVRGHARPVRIHLAFGTLVGGVVVGIGALWMLRSEVKQ